MECDVLIQGGEVVDPSQGLRGVRDVLVTGDRISGMVEHAASVTARHTIDARGLLVVPGLIDLHGRLYWGGTVLVQETGQGESVFHQDRY